MADSAPEGIHLAELHEIAARLGVPRFRMLTRDALAEEIRDRGGADELQGAGERAAAASEAGRAERGGAGRGGRDRERARPDRARAARGGGGERDRAAGSGRGRDRVGGGAVRDRADAAETGGRRGRSEDEGGEAEDERAGPRTARRRAEDEPERDDADRDRGERDRERDEDDAERPKPRRRGRRGGRRRQRDDRPEGREDRDGGGARRGREEPDHEPGEDAEPDDVISDPVTGVLDVTPRRFGFLRLNGLEPAEGDVYISASQIRRCELRAGDEVTGPAREPRRGERHRALVHVDRVNGAEPVEGERPELEDLTAVAPSRRIPLGSPDSGSESGDALLRAIDLLCPLALGQRVLVRATPRSGRSTLLRALARALASGPADVDVIVLLVDERPEEATKWRDEVPDAELAVATADMRPVDQSAIAELALARAKRRAESGRDAVLIVDSLSRLAVAYGDDAPAKRLFGSGRELSEEGAGSLTVIATALEGPGEGGEALRAVLTTENAQVRLDAELVDAGVVPAVDVRECRAAGEAEIRGTSELEGARKLRERLSGREPADAARELGELLRDSKDNEALLGDL